MDEGIINPVIKVKRKQLDEFNDHFSDFSLSSPACKIRRLDVELPPFVENEDTDLPMRYEQVTPHNEILKGFGDQLEAPVTEELPPSIPENEEKAIVLFKPMDTPLSYSGSNFSIDPNLIASFKNQALWGVNINHGEPNKKDEDSIDADNVEASACRAVIPWVPSHKLSFKPELVYPRMEVADAMDAEDSEVTTMETEDAGSAPDVGRQSSGYCSFPRLTEGMPSQWQHLFCTLPQPLQNTATPVVWYQ